jgi:hypothetical protein
MDCGQNERADGGRQVVRCGGVGSSSSSCSVDEGNDVQEEMRRDYFTRAPSRLYILSPNFIPPEAGSEPNCLKRQLSGGVSTSGHELILHTSLSLASVVGSLIERLYENCTLVE